VVGAAMLLAGIGVMLVVGVWASRLGDPPGWQFDCQDTNSCEDLWISARHHYWAVAAGAAAVAVGGWVVIGTGLPEGRPAAGGPVEPAAPVEGLRTTVPTVLSHLLMMLVVAIVPTRIYWAVPGWIDVLAVVVALLLVLGLVGRHNRAPQEDRRERARVLRRVVMLPVVNGAIALAFAASAWTVTFSRPFAAGLVTAVAAVGALAICWWLRRGQRRSPRSAYFAAGASRAVGPGRPGDGGPSGGGNPGRAADPGTRFGRASTGSTLGAGTGTVPVGRTRSRRTGLRRRLHSPTPTAGGSDGPARMRAVGPGDQRRRMERGDG
jgi:hypothetical protein